MYKIPFEKMICDSDHGDGGVYFYEEYLEWLNRDTGRGFRIQYKNIEDVEVRMTQKKTIVLKLVGGKTENLYLYKYEQFMQILNDLMDKAKGIKKENVEPIGEGDMLSKLERLAKLHESGALTDEEFALAKQKILEGK